MPTPSEQRDLTARAMLLGCGKVVLLLLLVTAACWVRMFFDGATGH